MAPLTCIYVDEVNNIKCDKRALYNYEEEKGCRYCKDHALDNMVNKNYNICSVGNCKKRASYKNAEKKHFCGEHKVLNGESKIVNTNHKKCQLKVNDKKVCKERALYNFKGMDPEYCHEHKEDNMICVYNEKYKQ